MATFGELGDALAGAHLNLPIRGKTYRVEDVPADVALQVEQLIGVGLALAADDEDVQLTERDVDLLGDGDERDFYERLLGDTYQEMIDDGLGWTIIKHAGMTVMAWVLRDEDAAAAYWASGGGADALGEALAPTPPNRASRRASEAAGRKTQRRASTNGTSRPRRRPRDPARAADPSPGSTSSPSGS